MKIRKIAAILGLVFTGFAGAAGAAGSDVQYWEQIGFDWSPFAKAKIYLEKQLRYENTFTRTDSDITEIGLGYTLTPWLDARVDYRFVSKGRYEKVDRIDGNLIVGWTRPGFSVSNRFRLQQEYVTKTLSSASEMTFRDRLRVTLRPDKKLQPFGEGEIFVGLGEDAAGRNKYRLRAGLDYDISKRVTLTAFYMLEQDTGEKTNETFHIFGGKFTYSF